MSFGSRLRKRRKELNLKQTELGELLGVTGSAIGNYENDLSSPKADVLYKVFEALKCDANYLYQDEMKARNAPIEDALSIPEHEHIQNYRLLTPEGQKAADESIHILLDLETEKARQAKQAFEEATATLDNIIEMPKRRVPFYEIGASAGTGDPLDDSPFEIVEIGPEAPIQTSYLVSVDGDSMEPRLHDGQTLYIRQQETIEPGEIGLFWYDGDSYVKKFEVKHGRDYLVSLNPAYDPIEIEEGLTFCPMGKVLNT